MFEMLGIVFGVSVGGGLLGLIGGLVWQWFDGEQCKVDLLNEFEVLCEKNCYEGDMCDKDFVLLQVEVVSQFKFEEMKGDILVEVVWMEAIVIM